MEPSRLDLKIYQGATFQQALEFRHAIKLLQPIAAGATTARVTAATYALPAGYQLEFWVKDELVPVTLTQPLAIGGERITFAPAAINIPTGSVADTSLLDLTGKSYRGQLRSKHGGLLANFDFSVDAAAGLVQMSLSATITAGLPSNLTYYKGLEQTPNIPRYGTAPIVPELPHQYDVEQVEGSIISKVVYGPAWVVQEATYV